MIDQEPAIEQHIGPQSRWLNARQEMPQMLFVIGAGFDGIGKYERGKVAACSRRHP
jgi:hypothetical protein